jgi:hypothetical protein
MSFLWSPPFPVGIINIHLTGGIFQAVNAATPPAFHVEVVLVRVGVLIAPETIGIGHFALDRAKRRAYWQPLALRRDPQAGRFLFARGGPHVGRHERHRARLGRSTLPWCPCHLPPPSFSPSRN